MEKEYLNEKPKETDFMPEFYVVNKKLEYWDEDQHYYFQDEDKQGYDLRFISRIEESIVYLDDKGRRLDRSGGEYYFRPEGVTTIERARETEEKVKHYLVESYYEYSTFQVTQTMYDKQFALLLKSITPTYEAENALNYHYENGIYPDKKKFLDHMEFVVLDLLKYDSSNRRTDISKVLERWVKEKRKELNTRPKRKRGRPKKKKERIDRQAVKEEKQLKKLKWNGNKNTLTDMLWQLRELKNDKGEPFLETDSGNLALFLKENFECFENTSLDVLLNMVTAQNTRPKRKKNVLHIRKGL